jgi:hypothetical protein
MIPTFALHNSDARRDTREWPPAVVVDLFCASAALNAWSSKSFIKYVRERSKVVYYDQSEADDQSGCERYRLRSRNKPTARPKASGSGSDRLRSRNKTSTAQPKESRLNDLMLSVCVLWKHSKPEGVRTSRNEGVEKWLQPIEDSVSLLTCSCQGVKCRGCGSTGALSPFLFPILLDLTRCLRS